MELTASILEKQCVDNQAEKKKARLTDFVDW